MKAENLKLISGVCMGLLFGSAFAQAIVNEPINPPVINTPVLGGSAPTNTNTSSPSSTVPSPTTMAPRANPIPSDRDSVGSLPIPAQIPVPGGTPVAPSVSNTQPLGGSAPNPGNATLNNSTSGGVNPTLNNNGTLSTGPVGVAPEQRIQSTQMFQQLDINRDGFLSSEEVNTFPALNSPNFRDIDTNRDGQVTMQEIQTFEGRGGSRIFSQMPDRGNVPNSTAPTNSVQPNNAQQRGRAN